MATAIGTVRLRPGGPLYEVSLQETDEPKLPISLALGFIRQGPGELNVDGAITAIENLIASEKQ